MSPGRARTALIAVAVGAVAIALRVWRLGWGLEDGSVFPDELLFSARLEAFSPFSWRSFAVPELTYPALYGYLGGVVAAFLHAVGATERPQTFSMDAIYVLRAVSAAAGVANVALVGLLGARLYSRAVGLGAAALVAVLPLEVLQVHYASVDVVFETCTILTMLTSLALARSGTIAAAALAGGAAGLAFAAKYTGVVLLAPVAWAALESTVPARAPARLVLLGAVALGAFVVAAALACPPCALDPALMTSSIRLHLWNINFFGGAGFSNNHLVPTLGWYGRPCLYELVASLPFSLGWPLYGLSLLGVALALRRMTLADRLVLATVVPCFLLIGRSPVTFPRYLLPLFPGLAVLASRVALERTGAVRLVVLATVWGYSLALTTSQVARFSYDQQKAVVRWIVDARAAQRLPATTRVAVPYVQEIYDYVKIAPWLAKAKITYVPAPDGQWLDGAPDVFVLPEWKAIAVRRDSPGSPVARDLDRIESGAAGYREAARWTPSPYLQSGFYSRLDPAFAADLWQGEIGFTIYVRQADAGRPPG